jgi:AraC-like DNA-binding protein
MREPRTEVIEPDDYQTSLKGYGIELLVTCAGRFTACATRVELSQLNLLCAKESMARVAHLRLASTLAFVTFPVESNLEMTWAGIPVRSGDIVFHGLGERMYQWTTGGCRWGAISLDPKTLVAHSRAMTEQDLVPPPDGQVIRAPPSMARWLKHLQIKACRLAETKPNFIVHPEVARALEQDLIHALVTCLAQGDVVAEAPAQRRHACIMTRFAEATASSPALQLPIPELCQALGVSERGFRICCAEFLGMSPNQYLRLRRLHAAWAELRHADPETHRVTEVAQRHGYSQVGRFATAYHRLFGEKPSETLRHKIDRR